LKTHCQREFPIYFHADLKNEWLIGGNKARRFGDDDIQHTKRAARGNIEAYVKIAARTLNDVGNDLTDSLGLDRALRSRAPVGLCKVLSIGKSENTGITLARVSRERTFS
jgi:hypothetical protein